MKHEKMRVYPTIVPIEFKEINPSDFPGYIIDGGNKIIISPDTDGYIGEQLKSVIKLEDNNTVIINAGVGQGKSTTCIDIAFEYYNLTNEKGDNKYVVIFVAPFKTIINQYNKKLINKGVLPNKIFNYKDLAKANIKEVSILPVHILTINTLIGDYGEDAFMQSRIKREYLTSIINYCTKKDKKVVFIFDEIHEYIGSFKSKFIFNLWKWYPILHKSFLLSATFTEGAKVVIKILAELTNDKIQILETERVKIADKQSRLHLWLHDEYAYKANDIKIAALIKEEIKKGKKIQILVYAATLSNDIAIPKKNPDGSKEYSEIGKVLIAEYNKINLCIGGENGEEFKPSMCNVGTTFKTGISIEEENVSYFIITPSSWAYEESYNKGFGIFSNGMTSVIQAVARLRNNKNADIFIVMPLPNILIKNQANHIGSANYLSKISKIKPLKHLKRRGKYAEYHTLESQHDLITRYYKASFGFALKGIKGFNSRFMFSSPGRSKEKPEFNFPDLNEVILNDGDRYLSTGFEIFGSNISCYILWAAFNSQFENCTLENIYYEPYIIIKEGEVIEGLLNILYNIKGVPLNMDVLDDKKFFDIFYHYVTEEISIEFIPKKKDEKSKYLKSNTLKLSVFSVLQYMKGYNIGFNNSIYPKGRVDQNGKINKAKDHFIDKRTYINGAISHSMSMPSLHQQQLGNVENKLTEAYCNLYIGLQSLKEKIIFTNDKRKRFVPRKNTLIKKGLISKNVILKIVKAIKVIRKEDLFINDDTFSFCQWADKFKLNEFETSLVNQDGIAGKILDEFGSLFFDLSDTTISKTTIIKNSEGVELKGISKLYGIVKELDIANYSNVANVIYLTINPTKEIKNSEEHDVPQNP